MDHAHVFLFDPLQIEREKIGAEAFGHAVFETGRRAIFIGPQDPAATLFADIPFRIGIAQHGMLAIGLAPFHQRRVGLGHDILVLHRDGGDLDAQKLRRALGMVAGGGHHMLCRDDGGLV